jgi:hypothetical protein
MSKQWEVKWWRVGAALACVFGGLSLVGVAFENVWLPWYEGRELVRENPYLGAVPAPVSDKTVAKLDGVRLDLFGVSLQVPWNEVVRNKTVGNTSLISFEDDRSLFIFDPSTAFSQVRALQGKGRTQREAKAIRNLFGTRALSSNYDLMAAELATPAESSWRDSLLEGKRRAILLTLKSVEMNDSNAVYGISANELHGFQFGNPAVAPFEVSLVLFDRNDRRYEISLGRKEKNAPFVTQAEVNAIVASIRPIPHS